jgi:hypothetical protein
MNIIRLRPFRLRGVLAACILSAPMLVACGKSALPVSIHGVNYSVDPFSFELQDPSNPNNKGDGELVDSYAAGGTTCCYELPKKWRRGIKVSIQSKHWSGKSADDSLHDIASTHLVEVPQYADGKPGELWVLRAADGSMDIVSSDFQPDHPKWPGKVKGWPVPSLGYQRTRWDLYIKEQLDYITMFESLKKQFDASPDKTAQDDWNVSMENNRKTLAGFSGPSDPRFRARLKKEYEQGLIESRAELIRLQAGRP